MFMKATSRPLPATKHNPPLTHADVKVTTTPMIDDNDLESKETYAVKKRERQSGID